MRLLFFLAIISIPVFPLTVLGDEANLGTISWLSKVWPVEARPFFESNPGYRIGVIVVGRPDVPLTPSLLASISSTSAGSTEGKHLSALNMYAMVEQVTNLPPVASSNHVDALWYIHPDLYVPYTQILGAFDDILLW
jgi:hypothetical protein